MMVLNTDSVLDQQVAEWLLSLVGVIGCSIQVFPDLQGVLGTGCSIQVFPALQGVLGTGCPLSSALYSLFTSFLAAPQPPVPVCNHCFVLSLLRWSFCVVVLQSESCTLHLFFLNSVLEFPHSYTYGQ